MTSLLPALLQILAVLIDSGYTINWFTLRESLRGDPTAHRFPPHAAVAGDLVFGNTIAKLLNHFLIVAQSAITFMLRCSLPFNQRSGS